jgi:hypothetical protein
MSLTKRAIVVLATLGLGAMSWGGGSFPGSLNSCVSPAAAAGSTGCCHYNKGVCGCEDGRPRCCDGKVSASCSCPSITTRQITIDTQPLISVADFAFASQQTPEPPSPRLALFRLGSADALRFWFRLDCNDECWSRLAVDGALALEVRWLFDPGSGPLLEGAPQSIMLPRNRSTVFVARPAGQLRQGRWETEVRFDTERLCTRGDDRCWFRIQVQR